MTFTIIALNFPTKFMELRSCACLHMWDNYKSTHQGGRKGEGVCWYDLWGSVKYERLQTNQIKFD